MIYQAHRGVSTEYPENTMPAFLAAIEQGYTYIETDPLVTRDGVTVLLHDKTLNRTCRNVDGSALSEQIELSRLTYAEALNFDAGVAFNAEFRGTHIPKLAELLGMDKFEKSDLSVDIEYKKEIDAGTEIKFTFQRAFFQLGCWHNS